MSEEKPVILGVDDSRVMRKALSKVLGKDYQVVEAEHGEDAWTYITNNENIQVVFTDLNMPYLDGFGLLERIRSSDDPRISELPVIIITGKDDDDTTKQRALDKGADDFITKPFDSVQLLARAKANIRLTQTSQKLHETSDRLEQQAAIDQVTGLGGQTYFCKAAEANLSYLKRHEGQCTLWRMDIDDFNTIFIANGKAFADQILGHVGKILKSLVREEDMLARIGLAKFAMMLTDTSIEDAMKLSERIRAEINKLVFKSGEHTLKITVSAGLLEPKLDKEDNVKGLLQETEKYLAKAIEAGGNQIVVKSLRKATKKQETTEQPAAATETKAETAPTLPEINLGYAQECLARKDIGSLKENCDVLLSQLMTMLETLESCNKKSFKAEIIALKSKLGS